MHSIFSDFTANYNGTVWGWNGPTLVTKILKIYCKLGRQSNISEAIECSNFTIFPPEKCYEIHFTQWPLFFRKKYAKIAMERIKNSYFVHVWNSMSKNHTLRRKSMSAYIILAQQYCPKVLKVAGDFF